MSIQRVRRTDQKVRRAVSIEIRRDITVAMTRTVQHVEQSEDNCERIECNLLTKIMNVLHAVSHIGSYTYHAGPRRVKPCRLGDGGTRLDGGNICGIAYLHVIFQ